MRFSSLSALALIVLASGPGADARPEDESPDPVKIPERVKKELGERAVSVLSGATKVEAFRLAKGGAKAAGRKGEAIGADKMQFPITATGKEMGKPFAAKVRALLFDEATRTLSGASGFRGDVGFRLWKGKESVTVVIDFEGSQFLIVARDAEGKRAHAAVGGFLFGAKGEFDKGPLFNRVKALAVEAFPDDAALKALKKVEVDPVDPLKP